MADASQYRDPSIDLPATFGVSAVRIGEDRWVPHVTSVCQQIVHVAKAQDGYALIHVPEVPAQKQANVELLLSVDDCYVATLQYEADPEEIFNSRAQAWKLMALQGRLSEVMTEIDSPALADGVRLRARAVATRNWA